MFAVASFLFVLFLSMTIVRIASVALSLTGMSTEAARFQARSAWTGTGFTTAESEAVVKHPVRRKIVTILMIARSAGLVTAATTLILSVSGSQSTEDATRRLFVILAGVLILWLLATSSRLEKWMNRWVAALLKKYADLEVRDYMSLFHLRGEYAVSELEVEADDWIAGRTLIDLALTEEGALVLGIEKDSGAFIGAPRGRTEVEAGDRLILYGRTEVVRALDERKAGLEGAAERYAKIREQKEIEKSEAEASSGSEDADQTDEADDSAPDRADQ